jgi:hypothetical protein
MESNGRLKRRSTEPAVAKKRTQDRKREGGEAGGETTDNTQPDRGVHKAVMLHGIPYINVNKNYNGKEVREFLAIYRNKYYQKNRELLKVKYSLKRHKDKKRRIISNYIERTKAAYRLLKKEQKRIERLKKTNKKKLEVERKKYDQFVVQQKKEIRKKEREKLKYKYVDVDGNTNPRNYDIITWIRIYTKINVIRRRTKLKSQEVLILLWIYSNGEGNSKSIKWSELTDMSVKYVRINSQRLLEFNLIKREKRGNAYYYDLTERGNKFITPIIEFVKQKTADAKRVKRKYVRNRVQPSETTPGIQDGGDSVQQEGAVL